MSYLRLSHRLSLFLFGFLALAIQSLDDLGFAWLQFWDDSFDPLEERERRKADRERREQERIREVSSKTSLRKFIQIHESKLNEDWANQRIHFDKALEDYKPKRKITVAVIDTGVDLKNKEIQEKLFTNQGETGIDSKGRDKRTNGIDDDKNGFIDDVHGWDFADNDAYPQDIHGHGTHISGIILNGLEEVKEIEILPLQFFKESQTTWKSVDATIKAIHYAIAMDADIINYSAGGGSPSQKEKEALMKAQQNGILVVSAAGNEGQNTDIHPYYPANYDASNIISVGGIAINKRKVKSSNYGQKSVDIFAPGEDISSLGLNNKTKKLTGTSQATAYVTKAAALLMAKYQDNISPEELKEHILSNSNSEESLKTYSNSAKVLDISKVVRTPLKTRYPARVEVTNL